MKRLVVLCAFLLAVNSVNAGVVDLLITGLNGQPINPTKEIFIIPSDIVDFDVVYTASPGWDAWSLSLDMVVEYAGTLDISTITRPAGYWNTDLSKITATSYGALLDFVANDIGTVPQGIILDHFRVHIDDNPGVFIRLIENPNTAAGATLETDGNELYPLVTGSGIIMWTPEPTTITLLGLGGLFILRRKR